jgi:hypothetical protein
LNGFPDIFTADSAIFSHITKIITTYNPAPEVMAFISNQITWDITHPEFKYYIANARNVFMSIQHDGNAGRNISKYPHRYLALACVIQCESLYHLALRAAVWHEFNHRHGKYTSKFSRSTNTLLKSFTNAERTHIVTTIRYQLDLITSRIRSIDEKLESASGNQRHVISQDAATMWFSYLDAKIYANNKPWRLEETLNLYRDIFLENVDVGLVIGSYRDKYPESHLGLWSETFYGVRRDIRILLEYARDEVVELFQDGKGMYYGTLTGCPFFDILPGVGRLEMPWGKS